MNKHVSPTCTAPLMKETYTIANYELTPALSTQCVHLQAPALRTIDFQRITPNGIDFIRKRGRGATNLTSNKSSSLICSFGKYRTGEKMEQWLAEGKCEVLFVGEEGGETQFDLLKVVPERSIVELVASRLVKEEGGMALEDYHRRTIPHLEIVQKTRNKLLGELTHGKLDQSMMLVRFVPYRMERYVGGPEQVMWERWERKRDDGGDLWEEPKRLLLY